MQENVMLMEFQKEYRGLNLKKKRLEPQLFALGMMVAYASEIEKGFMVTKQYRTTKEGTKFTYKKIVSKEEAVDYKIKIEELMDDLNTATILEELRGVENF